MAIPSSYVLRKTGFKSGMSVRVAGNVIGALIFVPAALTRTYSLFLIGLFVMGTGLALLQTASNPYVTILGPIESAAKRISIMGICNKMAGVIAPLMLGAVILENINPFVESLKPMDAESKAVALDSLAHRVIIPYLLIFGMLIVTGNFLAIYNVYLILILSMKMRMLPRPMQIKRAFFNFLNLLWRNHFIFLCRS